MPNPVSALVDKHFGADFLPRLKQTVFGLAEDYWHDGPETPFFGKAGAKSASSQPDPGGKTKAVGIKTANGGAKETAKWHAIPGEISEKMWGAGFVVPGGEKVWEMLTAPLGMNKSMNILDL